MSASAVGRAGCGSRQHMLSKAGFAAWSTGRADVASCCRGRLRAGARRLWHSHGVKLRAERDLRDIGIAVPAIEVQRLRWGGGHADPVAKAWHVELLVEKVRSSCDDDHGCLGELELRERRQLPSERRSMMGVSKRRGCRLHGCAVCGWAGG